MLRRKPLSRVLAGGLAVLFMGSLLAACDPKQPNGDSPPTEPQQPGMQSPDSGGGTGAGTGNGAGSGAYPGGGEQQN